MLFHSPDDAPFESTPMNSPLSLPRNAVVIGWLASSVGAILFSRCGRCSRHVACARGHRLSWHHSVAGAAPLLAPFQAAEQRSSSRSTIIPEEGGPESLAAVTHA